MMWLMLLLGLWGGFALGYLTRCLMTVGKRADERAERMLARALAHHDGIEFCPECGAALGDYDFDDLAASEPGWSYRMETGAMPCGHPDSTAVQGGTTMYCRECEAEAAP